MQPLVLVIEDDRLLSWALCAELAAQGLITRSATTVAECQRVLANLVRSGQQPHAVLLDYQLPDAPGTLPLLHELRERFPRCGVVMMSGDASPEVAAEAVRSGAAAFLDKPFDLTDAVQTVSALAHAAAEPAPA